ncbi:F-box domain, Leucine-rich repeat domain, L domain-like protein [Artemisia annua]|uniref:F-box domain, Leucine-rich repeat domain, L domain-like protein n=1 Tax=Artemisia annua TaxID=35608 RepID=A0A2U1LXX1_ARTAN|nr:F-box domain, Leucine-rich repeat domain, L domain-like protein [Artemisia annua]
MGSRHDAKRMNVEGDRLSSLPDDLIHKILSSISLKQAIETSSLSSRWRYIWTSMPYLDFSTEGFSKLNKFSKFVTNILSRRNNQVQLSSVKLSFRGKATQVFVKRILNYAFSHNVEQLTVVSFALKDDIPINLFSSQSLKHLMLTLYSSYKSCTLTSTWDLPALTTLCLSLIILDDDDLFSHCPNLKNLTLNCCQTKIRLSEKSGESEESHLNICHSKLSNLTLEDLSCYVVNVVNVEAPQLKNLIIRKCYVDVVNVEAPQLKNLIIRKGYSSVNLSADVLSLEKVDLTISYRLNAQAIVGLLQQFRSVKFLTLNLEIVECLSSSVELISHQPSPFATLKSLKIYPARKELHPKANVSTLVENYFLDSSPGATLTMVLREEIRANKLMEELQGLLDQWKVNNDKNTASVDQGQVENQRAQQETIIESQSGERLTQIKSYWSDLTKWSEEGHKRTCLIISMLQEIESLLIELPASPRAKMQPMYSCLYAEADTFMDNMIDHVRIHCDKKPRRSSAQCHELATPSQPLP